MGDNLFDPATATVGSVPQWSAWGYDALLARLSGISAGAVNVSSDDKSDTILTLTTDGSSTATLNPTFDVTPGSCIHVRCVACFDDPTHRGGVKVRLARKGKELYNSAPYIMVDKGDWFEYTFRFPIPRDIRQAEVSVCALNGTMRLRDVEISCGPAPTPVPDAAIKYTAHLGMIAYAPRNTMPAFQLAKTAGFWGCVINTGLTADSHIVCLHDHTIDATSNGTGDIGKMTLAEVRQYDFGSRFNDSYTNTKIPLLSEVLEFCARSGVHPVLRLSRRFLDNSNGVYTQIYELLNRYGLLGRATLKGFDRSGLEAAFAVFGHKVRYGYCLSNFDQETITYMKGFQREDGTGAYIDCHHSGINSTNMALAKAAGMPVESWIVNDHNIVLSLLDLGVTGFTTDNMCLDGCMY